MGHGKPLSRVFQWRLAIRDSPDLPSRAKGVAHVLATYMDAEGRSCFPSLETIQRGAGMRSKETVWRAVCDLENAGFIKRVPGGNGTPNNYTAMFPDDTAIDLSAIHDGTTIEPSRQKASVRSSTRTVRSSTRDGTTIVREQANNKPKNKPSPSINETKQNLKTKPTNRSKATDGNEFSDALSLRLFEICEARGAAAVNEAEAVVTALRKHVAETLIDEAIGYVAQLDDPPRHARYLLKLIPQWARQRGCEVPGFSFDPSCGQVIEAAPRSQANEARVPDYESNGELPPCDQHGTPGCRECDKRERDEFFAKAKEATGAIAG